MVSLMVETRIDCDHSPTFLVPAVPLQEMVEPSLACREPSQVHEPVSRQC